MIDQLLCAPIPENCVAVCLVSGNSAALLSKSGQCLLLSDDIDAMVRDSERVKRIIIRGERATATTVSNLSAGVLSQLIQFMVDLHEAMPGKEDLPSPLLMMDPDNPSALARQMIEDVPEIERFARVLLRSHTPEQTTGIEPPWASALGVARAPRAAREALMDAIAEFGHQVNNPELATQAHVVRESLRARDASIGQKRPA